MFKQHCFAACAHLGQEKLLLDITHTKNFRVFGNVCTESNTCVKKEKNTFMDPVDGRTITTNIP